jgi:hypothetical protein
LAPPSQLAPPRVSRPPLPFDEGARLSAPAEEGTALVVDLAANGLVAAGSVPLRPAVEVRRRPEPEAGELPLVVVLGGDDGYRRSAARGALMAIVALLGVLVVIAIVITFLRG